MSEHSLIKKHRQDKHFPRTSSFREATSILDDDDDVVDA